MVAKRGEVAAADWRILAYTGDCVKWRCSVVERRAAVVQLMALVIHLSIALSPQECNKLTVRCSL